MVWNKVLNASQGKPLSRGLDTHVFFCLFCFYYYYFFSANHLQGSHFFSLPDCFPTHRFPEKRSTLIGKDLLLPLKEINCSQEQQILSFIADAFSEGRKQSSKVVFLEYIVIFTLPLDSHFFHGVKGLYFQQKLLTKLGLRYAIDLIQLNPKDPVVLSTLQYGQVPI